VSGLPIMLEGSAVRALIVGGGTVASRKAAVLIDAGAQVRVVAVVASDELRALAATGRIELVQRRYVRDDVGDAQLVIAATNDRAVNAAVTADAHTAARLVNVADAPADGSFTTMAIHRSGELVVGVSAGVPGAAARIRDAVGARFDSRYARALADLTMLRRLLLERGDGGAWRRHAAELFGPGFCDAVETGRLAERVASWR
jgi:precorrin-2 dehydrogenase/sirohydrochlorin ferrochelatase